MDVVNHYDAAKGPSKVCVSSMLLFQSNAVIPASLVLEIPEASIIRNCIFKVRCSKTVTEHIDCPGAMPRATV